MRVQFYILFILTLFCSNLTKGQDPSFSQFYFNKLYYNPAFAGLSGGIDISLTPRIQWPNIPGGSTIGGFQTYKASVDLDVSGINGLGGTGLIVVADKEGQTSLTTTMIGMPIIVRPIDIIDENNDSRIKFQFGGMISSMFRSVDWNKFLFSDQFDPIIGIVKPSSFWTNPSFAESSVIFPDITPGFVFEYIHMPHRNNFWNLQIGGAVQHILEPHFSFDNLENTIPRKYTMHANFSFIMNEDVELSPAIIFEKQASMRTYLLGTDFFLNSLLGGVWYRRYQNSDAINFVAGIRFDTGNNSCWYLYYSYDMTMSKLISSTFGSHEINISYKIDKSFLSNIGMKRRHGRIMSNPKYCPSYLYFRPSMVDH